MNKTCIIIAGPTAIGKTSVALELARHFSTDIISADSRQCYRELGIGVAKPTETELSAVRHYFINSHSIHDEVTAAGFEQYALEAANDIFSRNNLAIMVGGTGLYIRAFMKGMDLIPAAVPAIRELVVNQYAAHGLAWLEEELRVRDPQFYQLGEMKNPQRMMRALEVMMSTGNSILSFQKFAPKQRSFNTILIGLDMPRKNLYGRIDQRVDMMMDAGLLEEARALFPFRKLNALQTVGYRELFDFFAQEPSGQADITASVELIKQNSRHYAKRQLTWFRREEGIITCEPNTELVLEKIRSMIVD